MKHTLLTIVAILAALALPASGAPTSSTSSSSSKSAKSSSKASVEKMPEAQTAAKKLATDLTTTQKSKLLGFLNEADIKDLASVKGISTRRGAAIEKARPFKSVDEVVLVSGIGEGTFSELVKYGKTLTRSRSSSSSSRSSSSRKS